MRFEALVIPVLLLLLQGCAGLEELAPTLADGGEGGSARLQDTWVTPGQLTDYMAEVERRGPPAPAQLRRLEAESERSAAARIKRAWLLSRPGATPAALVRAQAQLTGLDGVLRNAGTRQLVRLLERNIQLERALAEERRKSGELSQKIEQIKSLELELQQRGRNTPAGTP